MSVAALSRSFTAVLMALFSVTLTAQDDEPIPTHGAEVIIQQDFLTNDYRVLIGSVDTFRVGVTDETLERLASFSEGKAIELHVGPDVVGVTLCRLERTGLLDHISELSVTEISPECLRNASAARNLKKLFINGCELDEELLRDLGQLDIMVMIEDSKITSDHVVVIVESSISKRLSLAQCIISDADAATLREAGVRISGRRAERED